MKISSSLKTLQVQHYTTSRLFQRQRRKRKGGAPQSHDCVSGVMIWHQILVVFLLPSLIGDLQGQSHVLAFQKPESYSEQVSPSQTPGTDFADSDVTYNYAVESSRISPVPPRHQVCWYLSFWHSSRAAIQSDVFVSSFVFSART